MIYRMQEACLNLEGEWLDQTVNILTAQHLAVRGANITITREPLPKGMELDAHVSQQKQILARELEDFILLSENPCTVDGQSALVLEFTWKQQDTRLHQMALAVSAANDVVNITATMPGPGDESCRNALLSVMMSFTFHPSPGTEEGSEQ
ncbi:MAG: DcrB-related protein [Geobacteraceae bacterium]|nr:DcrB-related protein [Geobacteraceae bacterium]